MSKAKSDFNNDGVADILWHHPETGTISPWFLGKSQMAETKLFSGEVLPLAIPASTGWEVAATADFNKDGSADILWYHPASGQLSVWWLRGTAVLSTIVVDAPPIGGTFGWRVVGTGDFDQDGNLDILWRQSSSLELSIWLMDTNGAHRKGAAVLNTKEINSPFFSVSWNRNVNTSEWQVAGTGDFDKNGQTDLLWRNPTTGILVVWLFDGLNVKSQMDLDFRAPAANTGWQLVGVDDYDRDGLMDLLWYHPASGTLFTWILTDKGELAFSSLLNVSVPESTGWKVVSR